MADFLRELADGRDDVAALTDGGAAGIVDEDIVAARRWLWQRCRILAEPGGSVALASLLTGAVAVHPGDTVVVVISGGNNPTIP